MERFLNQFKKGISDANKWLSSDDTQAPVEPNNNSTSGRILGGTKPGRVISISIQNKGPLGCGVEKSTDGRGHAIISKVLIGSQAESAGIQRGDIICHSETKGDREMLYEDFIASVKSEHRPFVFDVRRIEIKKTSSSPSQLPDNISADSYAKRQAIIDAAEARNNTFKAKTTLKKNSQSNFASTQSHPRNQEETPSGSMSDETRRAVEVVKKEEMNSMNQLGYNPYETARMSSGQGRNTTNTIKYGEINSISDPTTTRNDRSRIAQVDHTASDTLAQNQNVLISQVSINPTFDVAFATLISHPEVSVVVQSISIIRKLTINALTKGQEADEETSAKYRRVKLSNPKIMQYIVNVPAAVDILISFGFILTDNEVSNDVSLVMPPLTESVPSWIEEALGLLERHENELSNCV